VAPAAQDRGAGARPRVSASIEQRVPQPAAGSTTTTTVAICTYTPARYTQLLAAVASLRAQSRLPDQIVVVVDHDEALRQRAAQELDGVVVVANRHERGLSGARNTAVADAAGDVVVFLDDDAVAEPAWLETLARHFDDDAVVGLGTRVTPDWASARPAWWPPEFDWVVGCTYPGLPGTVAPIRNPVGAAMALRRSALLASGGFRSDLGRVGTRPVGCEETELCIRLARDHPGTRLVFEPAVEVRHLVPAERATFGYFRRRCYAEGLSKARVEQIAGRQAGLASERRYVSRVLPAAVLRGLAATARGDGAGVLRAGAIVAGLLTTVAGYLSGRLGLALDG